MLQGSKFNPWKPYLSATKYNSSGLQHQTAPHTNAAKSYHQFGAAGIGFVHASTVEELFDLQISTSL